MGKNKHTKPRTDPMINVWPLIRPMHYSTNFKPFIHGEWRDTSYRSGIVVHGVGCLSHEYTTYFVKTEPGLHRYSLQLLSCRSDEYIHQLDLNVRCGGLLRQTRKASEDLISTTNTMINFIFKLLNTKLQYTTHALISMHHMIALRSCHNKRFKVRTLRDIDTRSND